MPVPEELRTVRDALVQELAGECKSCPFAGVMAYELGAKVIENALDIGMATEIINANIDTNCGTGPEVTKDEEGPRYNCQHAMRYI